MSERLGEAVLELGTSDRGYSGGLRRAEAKAGRLDRKLKSTAGSAGMLKKALLAIGAAFAVRSIIRGLTSVTRAFGKQEEAVVSLRATLEQTGRVGSDALKQLTDNAARLQKVTTQGDEAIIQATSTLAILARQLKPAELVQAQKAMVALADTLFGGNVQTAAVQLGKSVGSATNSLIRYGISIDPAASASEKLRQIMAQTNAMFEVSKSRAETVTGRTKQLANAWGDLKEAIGQVLVTSTLARGRFTSITDMIVGWTDSIKRNMDAWVKWTRVAIGAVGLVIEFFKTGIRVIKNSFELLWNALRIGFEAGFILPFKQGMNDVIDAINKAIDIHNILRPLNQIQLHLGRFDTSGTIAKIDDLRNAILRDSGDIVDAGERAGAALDRLIDLAATPIQQAAPARQAVGGLSPQQMLSGAPGLVQDRRERPQLTTVAVPAVEIQGPGPTLQEALDLTAEQFRTFRSVMDRTGDAQKALAAATRQSTSDLDRMGSVLGQQLTGAITSVVFGLRSMSDALRSVVQAMINTVISAGVKALIPFQHGGIVGGNRPTPILAHPGEVVLSRQTVASMGGARQANALNAGGAAVAVTFDLRADAIPEPSDYGIIGTKPDVQRLLAAAMRRLVDTGFRIEGR